MVLRDESGHMSFAFEVVRTVREEEPELFDDELNEQMLTMLTEAVDCKMVFAQDVLSWGLPKHFNSGKPFPYMELQDVHELTNFFERRVSAYQVGIAGYGAFDRAF